MKKNLPFFLLTMTVPVVFAVYGFATYKGYSGAPGSKGTCASSCHGVAGGTIEISGFPERYVPGQTYAITISHSDGNAIRQFNGSCRIGTGSQNAGTIFAGTNTATYNTSGETNGVHFSSVNQHSGQFHWTAPSAGTGTVRLYIAGQQGGYNGQNSTLVLTSESDTDRVDRIVTGPGPGNENRPDVRVFPPQSDAAHLYEFSAYGSPHYGVNVTCGDVNGDLAHNIITGPGPGKIYGPNVRGFEQNGTPLQGLNFIAYGTRKWGVNVACGDIDRDGFEEIITGPGPGAIFGPHVRAFDYDGTPSVSSVPGVSFFAYGTRKWGANISGGDIDGDGFSEIITGPGPGAVFGPHVRGWNVDGGAATSIQGAGFFAYGTRKFGAVVSYGDLDMDGRDEIVTGPGPGVVFSANVRGWDFDGASVTPVPGCNFIAFPSAQVRYGARVYCGADLNQDGRNELVVGCGPDPSAASHLKVFQYSGTQVSEWLALQAFPSQWTYGVNVAAGRF
jgi:hypothetical protein